MHGWQRQRSAPLGVLLAGAIALIVTTAVATVFYLSIIRAARGLSAYTAGLPSAVVAHPLLRRASYHVTLEGPIDRETPAHTPSTVHRWRVTAPAAPDDPLCEGAAVDALIAVDDTGARRVTVPVPQRLYVARPPRPVPPRVLATCPVALAAMQHTGALEYTEEIVPRGLPVELVACGDATHDDAPLRECDDGVPSRVYPRESRATARARARAAMLRVAGCAGVFAVVCFVTGLLALRRFDRLRSVSA